MIVPLERSFRGLSDAEVVTAERLLDEQVRKLDNVAADIIACRVAVEQISSQQRAGTPYRVRVEVSLPNNDTVIVVKDARSHGMQDNLQQVIRSAFEAARRQVVEHKRLQRGEIKAHALALGFVVRLFRDQDFGFLQTDDGREVFFHRASVINRQFDRLEVGTQVRFEEREDDKGPQATTVQIVDKPGHQSTGGGDQRVGVPRGWREEE